jgi:hypothetical protein
MADIDTTDLVRLLRRFGRWREKSEIVHKPYVRGWLIGECKWENTYAIGYGDERVKVKETLTVLPTEPVSSLSRWPYARWTVQLESIEKAAGLYKEMGGLPQVGFGKLSMCIKAILNDS